MWHEKLSQLSGPLNLDFVRQRHRRCYNSSLNCGTGLGDDTIDLSNIYFCVINQRPAALANAVQSLCLLSQKVPCLGVAVISEAYTETGNFWLSNARTPGFWVILHTKSNK